MAPQIQICRATVELVADEQRQADCLSLRGQGLSLLGMGVAVEAAQGAVRIDLSAQAGAAVQVQMIGRGVGHEASSSPRCSEFAWVAEGSDPTGQRDRTIRIAR